MASDGLRSRAPKAALKPDPDLGAGLSAKAPEPHPAGPTTYGPVLQVLRGLAFVVFFFASTIIMHTTQFLGAPLYFIDKGYYYSWMAMTKQGFGILLVAITQWFAPAVIRISGDESVRGQLKRAKDGRLMVDFPERMVMMANHQIYTDWIYLWWTGYAGRMHGHIFIILKESLKYIPIIGPGMLFYGFIFMARNWAKDKPRIQHRLQKLMRSYGGPMTGKDSLDPMWLLIFPEGTNLSKNGRASSKKWSEKTGLKDMQHALLPRSTGLHFCLNELKDTIDWVYDCTIHYEGVPRGEYGQDIYTLRTTYFQGRVPKSVNMYWRRFAVSEIPLADPKEFEVWLRDRWYEKDQLLEEFMQNGRFPADTSGIDDEFAGQTLKQAPQSTNGYVETSVKQSSPVEFLQMFVPMAAILLVGNVIFKLGSRFIAGR